MLKMQKASKADCVFLQPWNYETMQWAGVKQALHCTTEVAQQMLACIMNAHIFLMEQTHACRDMMYLQAQVGHIRQETPAIHLLHAGVMGGVLQAMQVLQVALHLPVVLQVLHTSVNDHNLLLFERPCNMLLSRLHTASSLPAE